MTKKGLMLAIAATIAVAPATFVRGIPGAIFNSQSPYPTAEAKISSALEQARPQESDATHFKLRSPTTKEMEAAPLDDRVQLRAITAAEQRAIDEHNRAWEARALEKSDAHEVTNQYQSATPDQKEAVDRKVERQRDIKERFKDGTLTEAEKTGLGLIQARPESSPANGQVAPAKVEGKAVPHPEGSRSEGRGGHGPSRERNDGVVHDSV